MRVNKFILIALSFPLLAANGVTTLAVLPPVQGNPRNTEGDFIRLRDGRILFVYSKFTGGGEDHATAHLASRFSRDEGQTWSDQDHVAVPNEAQMNVMSVSLVRLRSGEIALFYVRKNSLLDARTYMRLSKDESRTWSEPVLCIPDRGYYVLNNGRATQLKSGRLVLPVARHPNKSGEPEGFVARGTAMCYLSDDQGKTWRRSRGIIEPPNASPSGLQEPGIVELKDGRLLMYMRTSLGSQYFSWSRDGGETWSEAVPSSLLSPLSPATIKRIPKTGDLLAVWNDHSHVDDAIRTGGKRTPLTIAISRDEGKTWEHRKNIADDPEGWYCYTAVAFIGDRVLLSYNAGGSGLPRLSRSVMSYFDLKWLYSE